MVSLLPTPEPPDPVEGALGHFEHSNWLKACVKALDAGTVHTVGGTGGALTVDSLIVNPSSSEVADILLRGDQAKSLWGVTAAGKYRWRAILGDNTAEGGSDSGSNFALFAYRDDGVTSSTVLSGNRASGLLTVKADPTAALGVATKQYVDNAVPIGAIIAYGGSVAPTGWHICNGTAHGSSALQAVIGSANTPDLSGRFIVGTGTNYPLKATGGAETVTLTAAQSGLVSHNHVATAQQENAVHKHLIDPPDVTTNNETTYHQHSGTTASMNRNSTHGHSMREGITTGDSDYWVDTADATPGGDIIRADLILDTNTNHEHTFSTGNQNAFHKHPVTQAAFWSGDQSAVHTHPITTDPVAAASAVSSHENRPPYYALVYIIKKV